MAPVRLNQGVDFAKAIPSLETLGQDYPGERLIYVILGQLQNGDGRGDKALVAFQKARAIGSSPRVDAFIAERRPAEGPIRQGARQPGVGREEPAQGLGALRRPLRHHLQPHLRRQHGRRAQVAGDVSRGVQVPTASTSSSPRSSSGTRWRASTWRAGRLDEAMKDYDKGYQSVPGSSIPEDQKQTWLGRLHHGKARTLARMGKHEEAWAEAETVRKMILDGRRGGTAVLARVSLRRRLRQAGGGRLPGRAGAPAAGGPEEPVRRAPAGSRLREGRAHEGGEGGVPEGARLAVGRHRAAARVSTRRRRRCRRCRLSAVGGR